MHLRQIPLIFPVFARPFLNGAQLLRDFAFPPVCLACNVLLGCEERLLCRACWARLKRAHVDDPLYRDTCAKVVGDGYISDLIAGYVFEQDSVLQSLMHRLKYTGVTRIGEELGRRLGDAACERLALSGFAGVIPVPLHRAKARERGYNQSEYIAGGIRSVTGLPVLCSVVRRQRMTATQTMLDMEERRKNVAGAFSLASSSRTVLCGRSFLLVDDVITTGATICSCARSLSAAGVERVVACAVAIAA
jgi:ComF family protein